MLKFDRHTGHGLAHTVSAVYTGKTTKN